VEAQWWGDQPTSLILGIGINISQVAIPPIDQLDMPATSVESELGAEVDRVGFLYHLLVEIQYWRAQLWEPGFLKTWESNLAFLGKRIKVVSGDRDKEEGHILAVGKIVRLNKDGALILQTPGGDYKVLHFGLISDLKSGESGIIDPGSDHQRDFHIRQD
jgi:biotin-(acetyl-CoA carboxylase) ligase